MYRGVTFRAVVAAAAALVFGGLVASAADGKPARTYSTKATAPLRTALFDPYTFVGDDATAYEMAHAAGASYLRLMVWWRAIAPASRSNGFVASDPTSPGYSWSSLDQQISSVEAAGLKPIVDIIKPPDWAFAVKPHGASAGSPNIQDLHEFASALATHYDGQNGVPRVGIFQVWNEPNNSLDLSPVSPSTYRSMVNAVASAVHAVSPADLVVAGGLDPFANKAKRFHTMAPLTFMRGVLCLSSGSRPHRTCKAKTQFDVWAHHPYTFGGPFGHAGVANDVSLGDLPRMDALLRTAVHMHQVVSSHPVQFWVTEFSWDTSPPRRNAAPLALQARWTSEALYQMWRSGVSVATWFLLEDRPAPSPFQSGLFFHSKSLAHARAKPTRQALRFPFVAYLGSNGTVRVWGRDATGRSALVTIERRHGAHGSWRAVARIRANRYGILLANLKLAATGKDWLRAAAAGSGNSLAFSLAVPRARRFGPWGN